MIGSILAGKIVNLTSNTEVRLSTVSSEFFPSQYRVFFLSVKHPTQAVMVSFLTTTGVWTDWDNLPANPLDVFSDIAIEDAKIKSSTSGSVFIYTAGRKSYFLE